MSYPVVANWGGSPKARPEIRVALMRSHYGVIGGSADPSLSTAMLLGPHRALPVFQVG